MEALETQGFFEAVYDDVSSETLEELFGPVLKELFGVPLDVKMIMNHSDMPYEAYAPRRPGCNFESLKVDDASSDSSLSNFVALLWPPNGNPHFCEVVGTYIGKIRELETMMRMMVVEALGVEKEWESLEKSVVYELRMTEYDAPENQETMVAMSTHLDINIITILRQQKGQGLEILTKDGKQLFAPPNSFSVIAGESLKAWSNGRVSTPPHRVKMLNNEKRHTIQFRSHFKNGCIIQAPEKLVDQDYPQVYKPYKYPDYVKFLFSKDGWVLNKWAENADTLKAYCGVEGENDGMMKA
ncbi:hypothetical protein J5N97_001686 [Dioscorea zingiberensis]|uniref:Isopenicillin N synthase-like Fe(2+) 2OG dioxygenase domain-containing protein n=1 Tax=Dioscorea zingiberensis TaxID=325984 RepID=A0A9D5H202_9LILI|nr:hypothetical protein J5N97_001686 [Dioscorea zingiberensis]